MFFAERNRVTLFEDALQRATLRLEQDQTAETLLLGQMALFCAELARQETRLARDQAGALLRQQRFLQAKRRAPGLDD